MKYLPLKYVARAIITDREGQILLVRHASHKPYTLSGGHVEEDETFQDACIREAREELSIVIELIGMVTITKEAYIRTLPAPVRVEVIECSNEKGPHRKYIEFFLAHHISGIISPKHSEIESFGWFTLDQIRHMSETDIYPNIGEIILSTGK